MFAIGGVQFPEDNGVFSQRLYFSTCNIPLDIKKVRRIALPLSLLELSNEPDYTSPFYLSGE
jgi:hypothetical protein